MKTLLLSAVALITLGLSVPAYAHCGMCEEKDNHGSEAVDAAHAAEKHGENLADHAEDAAEHAADEIEDTAEHAADAIEESAEHAEEAVHEEIKDHAQDH